MKHRQSPKFYHFQIWHVSVLLGVVIMFLIMLAYINSFSSKNLLNRMISLYRRDMAERVADQAAVSLEVVLEHNLNNQQPSEFDQRQTIRSLDIILSQQHVQRNVRQIYLMTIVENSVQILENGQAIYDYFVGHQRPLPRAAPEREEALQHFKTLWSRLRQEEQIISLVDENGRIFYVLVPFYIRGELIGAVYMKIAPDVTGIIKQVGTSFNESAALFSALVLLGLLVIFQVSVYMVRDRDEAQRQLYFEREKQIMREIEHQKEALFTKRIYHTHHKAEKVMGFIKEDLRKLDQENVESTRYRVSKYANFVSRAIYDMKSYEPPLHVIRGAMFRSNLNDIIRFIEENIFRRVYRASDLFEFDLQLDPNLPSVSVNEYVVWEIIEPLIQNCIEHNHDKQIRVSITTTYDPENKNSVITISDNGSGIAPEFLEIGENGRKRLFEERATSKTDTENAGYGCFLAFESCRRCGWKLDASNSAESGAVFKIEIKNA